jgi:hypothetical protein
MEMQTLTRKELYDLVWSQPMLTLSKKYNISDTGLKKICIRLNIPLPKAGHWQKLQFGKKINKLKLSYNDAVEQQITLSLRSEETKNMFGEPSPIKILQNEIENHLQNKLTVPESLTKPDILVTEAKKILRSQKPDDWLYKGTVRCAGDALDTRVAPENITRTLLFWDTLIKALRARGHDIKFRNRETYAIVDEHDFKIIFREKMKREVVKDGKWDRSIYQPTGILSFQMVNHPTKEWTDGKLPLEQQLSKIIAKLELAAREWTLLRMRHKKEEEERKEKERIIKEFEQRQEKELLDFKETLQKASRWHKANNLRNYINEVETKSLANNTYSEELNTWLDWARKPCFMAHERKMNILYYDYYSSL